jgi:hypothetical protein
MECSAEVQTDERDVRHALIRLKKPMLESIENDLKTTSSPNQRRDVE